MSCVKEAQSPRALWCGRPRQMRAGILSAAIPPRRGWHGDEESGQKGWVGAGLGLAHIISLQPGVAGTRGLIVTRRVEAQMSANLLLPLLP